MKIFEVISPFDDQLPPDEVGAYIARKRMAANKLSGRSKYTKLGSKLTDMTNAKVLAAKTKTYRRKTRDPELERYLMLHPAEAVTYAHDSLKGRWPEAEPYIMTNPRAASEYARKVIKGRWPEAEPYIIKDSDAAASYALYATGQRFPEAEPLMEKKGGYMAFFYAQKFIKQRWPALEETIIQKQQLQPGISYAEKIIGERWPELEETILNSAGWLVGDDIVNYAKLVIKGRWPEGEQKLLSADMTYPPSLVKYATDVIRNRWLEAEPLIAKNKEAFMEYGRKTMGSAKSSQFKQLKKDLNIK